MEPTYGQQTETKPNYPYLEIAGSLASLHTKVDNLRLELLGNGQPGRVQRLEADTQRIEQAYNSQKDENRKLSNRQWYLTGLLGGFSVAIQWIFKLVMR